MINYIMYLFGSILLVFSLRYGLIGASIWDTKISNKVTSNFTGFHWFYRIPFSIGVIPEYYFFLVLGGNNYFKTNWWALKTSAFISFLLFLSLLTNKNDVQLYYSLSFIAEGGFTAFFTSGITFWYLNLLNLFYVTVLVLVTIESIRMHKWYAPVRIIMYSLLSFFMATLTVIIILLIILVTILYVAYKIIKFLFFSSSRKKNVDDDDEDVSDQLNNSYRRFRAELYAWEDSYKTSKRTIKREIKKPTIKRKRPNVKRKPKPKPRPKYEDDDIPRFYPD